MEISTDIRLLRLIRAAPPQNVHTGQNKSKLVIDHAGFGVLR
jgi:hypothetical protein